MRCGAPDGARRAMTTKYDVMRVHLAQPDWTADQIAAFLGCTSGYVRATARRNGLVLRRRHMATISGLLEQADMLEKRAQTLRDRAERMQRGYL